jgi:uncharacterized protein YjbI with pentapeptide repeats
MAPPPDTRVIKGKRITREILQRLSELHRDWVVGRPSGKRAMLEDCDLTKLDFSHMNFTDGIFIRCRFDDCEGRGVKFVGAILRSSSFDRADLTNADFQRADLRSASFQDATMIGASLDRSDIRRDAHSEDHSSFKGAILTRANFADSKMKGADLSGAVLEKTNLSNADLRGASFRQAEMTGVVLAGATMIDSDFSGAVLDKSMEGKLDITCASGPARKKLDSGKLSLVLDAHHRWVLSLGTEGDRANLSGLDLSGIDLSGRNLAAANFNGATLAETCLEGAWLMAADFRTANLLRAKLGKADLRGADFTAAHQRGLDVEACVIGELPGSTLTTRGLQAKIASRA